MAAPAQTADEVEAADDTLIVVQGARLRGTVVGNVPPESELDEADIAAYGASSIEDLLTAIAPQSGSARGRGTSGRPIVLINGQRVSGFREIRDLPPEAIERVQVFPEELALRYGYRPDQRVINFILKPNFVSFAAEIEHGIATQGDYSGSEIEATITRNGENSRLNLDFEYEPTTSILESDRNIVQSRIDTPGLVDNGDFRTLRPRTRPFEFNGSYNRRFSETLSATLSAEYKRDDQLALLGLPGTSLTIPGSSPFARQAGDETIFRLLPAAGGALRRDTDTRSVETGLAVNGQAGEWRWALTGNYSRALTRTRTDRSDLSGLATQIAAGDPGVDPFAPDLGQGLGFTRDTSRSVSQNADANFNIAGSPFLMPAGPLTLSLTSGYEWRAIDSEATTAGVLSTADLSRDRVFGRANVEIPLTSRRDNVLAAIGDVSVNANIGYADLSDFGGLFEYGYGVNWEPLDGLRLSANFIGEEKAPTVQQLGNPVVVTPNSSIFDFTTGQSVLVDRITGGNPLLAAEERSDWKFSVSYGFGDNPDVRLIAEYIDNRSENVTSAFPLLTPEIEAAFPGRVVRDAGGNLLSVDARPVTFAEVESERLRYGFTMRGRIARDREESEGRRSAGRRGGGAPRAGGGGGRRGGPGGGRGRGRGNRWQLSLYHVYRFDETVTIRPGVVPLDLLDGSVTGEENPLSRHSIELEGGMFLSGIGFRLSGEYSGSARIDGTGLPGSSDLFFGDIAKFNLRAFFNFDSQQNLVEAVPFLRGSRLALRVDNIFDGVRRVTDQNGDVPLAYQPGFVEPRGRYIELSFRKRF